ncbi:uncharacterized protein [Typha latifolia]|uniref:uncharacterized protein n=1 Tax=Typha latifolia TaxID=4733 RepID=UPI003C2BFBD0
MSSSQFMDKQILGLSVPQPSSVSGGAELFDLMNPQEEINGGGAAAGGGGVKKDDILPNYDFQPIRRSGSSGPTSSADGPRSSRGSIDSKIASSNLKNAGILDPHEFTKVSHEEDRGAFSAATVAEIDRTVKKYADNLLHALEGVSSRLSQMESRTRHLESSVDDLKVVIGNHNGSTDGKLRQFENVLREVQTGVQVLRDKQDIMETQLQLAKLQASKVDPQPSENANSGQSDSRQQQMPPQQQTIQPQHQNPTLPPQPTMLPALPAPNVPPPPPPLQNPPTSQFSAHLPQQQIPSVPSLPREQYFTPSVQSADIAQQQYQAPVQPHQPLPPQLYQPPPQLPPQYSQPPQPATVNPSSQLQPPLPQQPEENVPYMPPPQTYPPSIRQPAPFVPPPGGPPPQQFYGPNPGMYEPPASRPSSGQPPYPAGYGPPAGGNFSDPYAYSGSPSHRSGSAPKPSPFASSGSSSGGSSNYTRLPTAQLLPQALPTGSTSGGSSGNRLPIDDVVDKVATMGFSRDQVRATVRRLTENGQSVDLNVVLDKLMNDGEVQPPKACGDPTMFESFWKRMGEKATVVIPGWQTMSYFSDPTELCWFLEADFAREVRRIHRLVGNAAAEDHHIVVGTGSTQLFQAALYALSPPDSREPTTVVSAAPYYSSYPLVTDYLRSGLFRWGGDAHGFEGEAYIELVCSPNNPDGLIREAVLKSEAGKTIHDLAYYWPQYTPIIGQADHEIMLFTVSKSTGHAGTRLGWALVKDRDVARKMIKFIELNTIGVSKDSQLRAAKILKVVSDGYELTNLPQGMDRLFDFGRRLMAARWGRLNEAVNASGIFSLPHFPPEMTCNFSKEKAGIYPAFAWMKCEEEEIKDCESFLRSLKILTRSGKHFGAGTNYVRVSMLDRDETFDLFIKRISSLG